MIAAFDAGHVDVKKSCPDGNAVHLRNWMGFLPIVSDRASFFSSGDEWPAFPWTDTGTLASWRSQKRHIL